MNQTDRMALLLLVGAAVLGVLAAASLWFAGDTGVDTPEVVPAVGAVERPLPAPSPDADPPAAEPEPEPATPEPVAQPEAPPEPMTPDVKRDFNYAMHDVVKEARFRCFTGWIQEEGMDPAETLVLDAVFQGGAISDIAIRGVGEVPDDVLECVREVAWEQEWPPYGGDGETRFQRTFPLLEPQAR